MFEQITYDGDKMNRWKAGKRWRSWRHSLQLLRLSMMTNERQRLYSTK